jgi:F-type H+-transporting ATPase subunit gamma
VANLKAIRKRISSVRSTQKITRAMKMVAGARLARAQQRITALRPYAVKTHDLLAELTAAPVDPAAAEGAAGGLATLELEQPLLVRRPCKNLLLLVITSDRGLCGAFNSNLGKAATQAWRAAEEAGQTVHIGVIGRKGRDYLRRRGAPVKTFFPHVWDKLGVDSAREVARQLLRPFLAGEVDTIKIVYNEFKSAMSQKVVVESLLPVEAPHHEPTLTSKGKLEAHRTEAGFGSRDFIFEPSRAALLERLVPMYVETSILRALYESMASELGARMTAMDSATKNADEMIYKLTLQYNRARQAAITTELMEIIGGANALQEG